MKSLIKKLLRENLGEAINQKPMFARGVEHQIYLSKSDPNIVFKVGYPKSVDRFVSVFTSNPKYFPKIFKVGDLMWEDKQLKYAKIEKLNTERVISEWDYITGKLDEIGIIDTDSNVLEDVSDIFKSAITEDSYSESYIISKLQQHDKKAYKLFIDWFNFLHHVNSIVEPVKHRILDIHKYNFGYDSSGKMKCLDI